MEEEVYGLYCSQSPGGNQDVFVSLLEAQCLFAHIGYVQNNSLLTVLHYIGCMPFVVVSECLGQFMKPYIGHSK